jgi:preprotein translocase subunit SecA
MNPCFGGERTIELMKKLGLQEDEPVGHTMITKSIQNAQSKLEKEVLVEHKTNSAQEWFILNVMKK